MQGTSNHVDCALHDLAITHLLQESEKDGAVLELSLCVSRREPPPTFWQTIVRGKVFASAVVLVVLLNTVLIGVQTQMDADGKCTRGRSRKGASTVTLRSTL
eukprot:1045993-Amphidinium_carterae.1